MYRFTLYSVGSTSILIKLWYIAAKGKTVGQHDRSHVSGDSEFMALRLNKEVLLFFLR